jgi:uncharacterized protein YkwD
MPIHFRTIHVRPLVSVAALLAAFAGALAPAATPATTATLCAPAAAWGKNRPDLASQVVTLINRYRASKGLRQLGVSSSLTASSTWKSLHMAGYRYFAHDDPSPPAGRSAFQRAKDCGFNGNAWGENIAWGYPTAQSVVNGWLNSPGHRANIESASFTSTGVGAANSGGRLYWTQSFGAGGAGVTPAPSGARPVSAIGGTPAQVGPATGARLVASVRFVHVGTGRPLTAGQVRCRAEVDGRRLRVLANVFKGVSARCAWSIPAWAKGKQLTGIVGVKVGNVAATRMFMRTLR